MIINMTIHNLTPSQKTDGGFEPSEEVKSKIKDILLIANIPTRENLEERARAFAQLCSVINTTGTKFLIGSGTPSIQPMIVRELEKLGIDYVYSHSERECVETHNIDGTVTKNYVFEHKGWY